MRRRKIFKSPDDTVIYGYRVRNPTNRLQVVTIYRYGSYVPLHRAVVGPDSLGGVDFFPEPLIARHLVAEASTRVDITVLQPSQPTPTKGNL